LIEVSSLVNEIDVGQSCGDRTEIAPNPGPSKPEAVKKPYFAIVKFSPSEISFLEALRAIFEAH
jgi:hypothetical protein